MSAAATHLLNTLGSVMMPIDRVDESKTNPRRVFNKEKMRELTESVRRSGVLQPILVRPSVYAKDDETVERYELVFGARRLRAVRACEEKHIPAIIREMTDLEVLEHQVIENQQREDVHPLEEADGYHALHKTHGKTVDEIAMAVGKSRGYIYARLRLVQLCKDARNAFYEGIFDVSLALLIARMGTEEVQKKATSQLLAIVPLPSYLDAKRILEHGYMLDLSRASFNLADKDLMPAAGACTTCPKRSGNQPELFPDKETRDRCTDPACFREKGDLHWKRLVKEAEDDGRKILGLREAKKLFVYDPGVVAPGSGYVDLSDTCWADNKRRTYRELLGKNAKTTLARDPNGGVHELLEIDEARACLKENGIRAPTGGIDAAAKRGRAARGRTHAVTAALMGEIVARPLTMRNEWQALAICVAGELAEGTRRLMERRGSKTGLPAYLKERSVHELQGILFEIVLGQGAYRQFSSKLSPHLAAVARALEIDLKKIEKATIGESTEPKTRVRKKSNKRGDT